MFDSFLLRLINNLCMHTAFSLFDTFKKNKPKNNLSEIELQALNSL